MFRKRFATLGVALAVVIPLLVACSPFRPTPTQTPKPSPTKTISPTKTPANTPTPTAFEVLANHTWQNSGLQVEAGNRIEIQYVSGSWTTYRGFHPYVGADGNIGLNDPKNPNHPVPGAYPGVLIAKIGNGAPEEIGSGATFQACESGALYLQMNDDLMSDNDGSIIVQITVSASTDVIGCPPSPTTTLQPTATPIYLTPTVTPDLNTIVFSRSRTESPDGKWTVQIEQSETVLHEDGLESFYARVIVISQDTQTIWIPVAEWREFGLGYNQPIVFHWSKGGEYLYLAEYAIPDGCPGFGFTSSLKRLHLHTGKIEPMAPQLYGVLSLSPDEATVAALTRNVITLHDVQTGQDRVINYTVEADFWISGNIVWSPNSNNFLFAAFIDGCSPPEMETSSLLLVDARTGAVTTIVSNDDRRLTIQEWTESDKVLLADRDGNPWWLDVSKVDITIGP